jgi:hypothetical protein
MGTCSGAAKRGSDLPGLKSVFCRKKKKMMMKCFKKNKNGLAGQLGKCWAFWFWVVDGLVCVCPVCQKQCLRRRAKR